MRWLLALSLLLVGLGLADATRAAERRVALVIGNANYTGAAELANTINDAEAIAAALEQLGFDVALVTNLERRDAIAAIDDFAGRLAGAEVALLFYAGHGLQIGGQNFLLPIDVDVSSERALRYSAIDIQEVVLEMERSAQVSVVVLDACRDNPFFETLIHSTGATRSVQVSRGLGPMRLRGRGAIIAYAAAAGQVAADGTGYHSPYTTALLEEIDEQGVEIGLMFRRVAGRVIDATHGVQRPELFVRLVDEVYLNPAPEQARPTEQVAAVTTPSDDETAQTGETTEPVEVARADNGNDRSARPERFFGNRVIYKPAWADAVALPEPPSWGPARAVSLVEADGNDSYGTGQPVPLAATVESRVTPRGDTDWYKVHVPIAGELRLLAEAPPENIDLFARVWDADKRVVRDWQGAGRPGGALDVGYALPGSGDYWIEVSDGRSDAESATAFSLTLDFLPANDPLEPNNRIRTAKPIPLPAAFQTAVYPRGDHDWFRVWVGEPGLLSLVAEAVPENLDIVMRLWDLDGSVVHDWAHPPRMGGDTVLNVELAVPGVYAIELADGRSDAENTATFALSARFRPVGDASEPNNRFGDAALSPNVGIQKLAIFPRGDVDWLSIDVDHPGELQMLATRSPPNLDIHMRVWNSNKDVIRDWIPPMRMGGDAEGFADLSEPGRYFIEITDGRSDSSSPDLFDFSLKFTPQPDQYEPNNGMSAAARLTPGGEILFNILPRGDTDWFRVEVPNQGELAVNIDEGPKNLDLHYRVWDANRNVIRDWVAPYRKGGLTEGFADLPRPGTYFIEVSDGRSDDRSIDHATLKTVFTPSNDPLEPNNSFGTARSVALGEARFATILPRGDTDWYLLQAPRAGAFVITVDQVDPALDIYVRLWDAEGNAGGWTGPPRPGGVTEARIPVAAAGSYRLEISDGRSDARSSVPFRVHVAFE